MRHKATPIVGGLLNCGMVTAVLWWMINSVWGVGGAGILQQQPWPLSNIYACTAVGAALGLAMRVLVSLGNAGQETNASRDNCSLGLIRAFKSDVALVE